MQPRFRPCRIVLRDGREAMLRAIVATDADAIHRAFDRLSADSRYQRFLQHKKQLDPAAVNRGVRPRPGLDFAFVATVPNGDDIEIVGAAQYVLADEDDRSRCEFAITVAEDWRGNGLARRLLASLLRRARRDGYTTMEGLVMADNEPMLSLARRLGFTVDPPTAQETSVVRVQRTLASPRSAAAPGREGPTAPVPPAAPA